MTTRARARPAEGSGGDLRDPPRLVDARRGQPPVWVTSRWPTAWSSISTTSTSPMSSSSPSWSTPTRAPGGTSRSATSHRRLGLARPQDFMTLVDRLHQAGYGVILDWVPSHFAVDLHGLVYFDGTHLYEHADPRQGFHPDWGTFIFNYGRNEVRSFLISSALFWLDRYHVDGLRVDAVASMLYLDYSRPAGQWMPNRYGGNENLESIAFLRKLNEAVYESYPGVETFAEESTAWPGVSRPTYLGGLGFGFKWDMGWMHDTLNYLSRDPLFRSHHHTELTFRGLYAFTENYCLPLSHDEVVHGKRSLLEKMPGDDWQKFANLRLLFVSQFAQIGEEAALHGCRDSPAPRVEPFDRSRLAPPPVRSARRCRASRRRPLPGVPRRAGSPHPRLRPGRLRVDRGERLAGEHARLPPQGRWRRDGARRPQRHTGAKVQLPGRRPGRTVPGPRSSTAMP